MQAARPIFERDGFLDARIADITDEAGTATGSFYSYFDSKEEIFEAVVDQLREEMHHPVSLDVLLNPSDRLVPLIVKHHRGYLRAYKRNAGLMRVVEEVLNISDDFRRSWTTHAQPVILGNRDAVLQLQEEGRADPALDPLIAGRMLSVLVSRAAYVTFVLERERTIGKLANNLTRMWLNVLKVPVPNGDLAALRD